MATIKLSGFRPEDEKTIMKLVLRQAIRWQDEGRYVLAVMHGENGLMDVSVSVPSDLRKSGWDAPPICPQP